MKKEDIGIFGKERISKKEKFGKVDAVFETVAERYDLMNDLMSLGIHRLWKRYAVELLDLGKDQVVLDLASGTGDISKIIGASLPKGSVLFSCDPNFRMLSLGRDKGIDSGLIGEINHLCARAESLPFAESSVDRVIIGFGLRNFTDIKKSLEELHHILDFGSRLVILEFSTVESPILSKLYNLYSRNVIPALGSIVAKDKASYQYLVDSIKNHPDQESLKKMMEEAGFGRIKYYNILSGIVTIHVGFRL